MRKKAPCKGCQERTLTCHGFCEKYKEWKAEYDRQHMAEYKEKEKRYAAFKKNKWKRGQY